MLNREQRAESFLDPRVAGFLVGLRWRLGCRDALEPLARGCLATTSVSALWPSSWVHLARHCRITVRAVSSESVSVLSAVIAGLFGTTVAVPSAVRPLLTALLPASQVSTATIEEVRAQTHAIQDLLRRHMDVEIELRGVVNNTSRAAARDADHSSISIEDIQLKPCPVGCTKAWQL